MRVRHADATRRFSHLKLFAAAMALIPLAGVCAAAVTISETGSTLIYPLFQAWVAAYAKVDPSLQITTGATGSGAGIAQAIAGRVQIGTSDAYMDDMQEMRNPDILNIPLAISAQTIDVNFPGMQGTTLRLSGPVLADIYMGKIRMWDAAPLAAINHGLRLPHHEIVPVRRADSSGDTFIFTQFLTFTTETDNSAADTWGDRLGYGTTVAWPGVSGSLKATGNEGVVRTIARTPYSVGYLGATYEEEAKKAGLITAMLKNQSGNFLLPNSDTVTAAVAELTPRTPPDERLTLVFAPGANSYPLINYEYEVVAVKQPNSQVATAISNFLLWCISPEGGSAARGILSRALCLLIRG